MSRLYPEQMNEHLKPVWCNVWNSIQDDRRGIESNVQHIEDLRVRNKWLGERIKTNLKALEQLEAIR